MNSLECLFFDVGGPLLCSNIERAGDRLTADVVNGAWRLVYRPGCLRACDSLDPDNFVTETDCRIIASVKIPPGMKGDYNALITWAESRANPRCSCGGDYATLSGQPNPGGLDEFCPIHGQDIR